MYCLTPGDPAGIGPEITWKTLQRMGPTTEVLCVGAAEPFRKLGAPIVEYLPGQTPKKNAPFVWLWPAPQDRHPGFQVGWSIQKAFEIVSRGEAKALVTGPIHKGRLNDGGFRYLGHTDFLGELSNSQPTMMMANRQMRISLVTTHLPLARVSTEVTPERLKRTIQHTENFLRLYEKVSSPKIAVLGLNPHAGENGLLGVEEQQVIQPVLEDLAGNGSHLSGPHPADTFFTKYMETAADQRPDAIICQYHDQGLIPIKLIDFSRTVNLTLGLPIARVSVDHGVAFDIAGKNQADPSSMWEACQWARRWTRQENE